MDKDCLFSLEVFVKDIQNLTLNCGIPAIAFRFLDYPTFLVYYTDQKNIDDIKNKIENVGMAEKEAVNYLAELRNSSNGYDFNKGKSCLLRNSFESLKIAISEVPLYITLIDCLDKGQQNKQPKLLGVCSMSLLSLFEKIEQTRQQPLEDSPAIAFEPHIMKIFNLMGTCIGRLNFTVKFTCYGSSLLKHMTVEEKTHSHINILLRNLSIGEHGKENDLQPRPIPPTLPVDKFIVPAEGYYENLIPSGRDETFSPIMKDSVCQVSASESKGEKIKQKKKKKKKRDQPRREQESSFEHDNMFCPPPLFLNLNPKEEYTIPVHNKKENIMRKSRYLTETKFKEYDERSSTDEEFLVERLIPLHGRKHVYTVTGEDQIVQSTQCQEKENVAENTQNQLKSFEVLKSSMPILCSLVSEIARLNEFINGCDVERGQRIASPPARLHVPKTPPKSNISSHMKSHLRVYQSIDESFLCEDNPPRLSLREGEKRKAKQGLQMHHQQQQKRLFTVHTKKKKMNLSYGLTRTQRLRYAMTHAGEDPIKIHNEGEFDEVNGKRKNIEGPMPTDGTTPLPMEQQQPPVDVGVQTSVGSLTCCIEREEREANDVLRKNTESCVGFYSPAEPRHITVSELFDDSQPWTSMNKEPTSSRGNYSDESFVSVNGTISVTSSISLPPVSQISIENNSPQIKRDDTLGRSAYLESFQQRSAVSQISVRSKSSKSSSHSGKSKSSSSSSSNSSNRSTTSSSQSKSRSTKSDQSRSLARASPDIPKQSAFSPIKSNYKRRVSESEQTNMLNITLPTSGVSDTLNTTTSYDSEL